MFFKRKKDNKQKQYNFQFPIIEGMDVYLWEAAKIIIDNQMASIGILQRALKIGFNRAFKIMEQLEMIGVVGKETGIKPRKILINIDELYRIAQNSTSIIQNTERNFETNIGKPLAQEERISMYNNHFDYMTGEDFELYIAQILGNIGFYNIQTTKGSGDQGVDILAEKDSIKYAFQCKRYDKPIGNKAVQEVFAGKFFYHCHLGVVVTNNYFTQAAKDLAHENGIVLWDRDYIQKLIGTQNEEKKPYAENNTLRQYNENRKEGELRILDIEEKIVAVEDRKLSKYLYQYLEATSRIVIDMFLEKGDGNPYTEDMIRKVKKPIYLYNIKFTKITQCTINLTYYCGMNLSFRNTNAYNKLVELSNKNNRKFDDDLFKISVFYDVCDIIFEGKEAKIEKYPEVDISTDTLGGIGLLEDIDEFDLQAGYKYLVTENFFPMKIDNIKFE